MTGQKQLDLKEDIKRVAAEAAALPRTRETALVVTKLHEAVLWLDVAIRISGEEPDKHSSTAEIVSGRASSSRDSKKKSAEKDTASNKSDSKVSDDQELFK